MDNKYNLLWSLLLCITLTIPSVASAGGDGTPHLDKINSFRRAKTLLPLVYPDGHELYCDCSYTPLKVIDASACGYQPRHKRSNRSERMEWEHIVTAHAFGHQRSCWRGEGCPTGVRGRKCCSSTDPIFQIMEGDLHNLVPALGELNGDRGNRAFGLVAEEPRRYGACDFEVDFVTDRVEPPRRIRGDIARITYYMEKAYGIAINDQSRQLLEEWAREDPVDDWERERNRRIRTLQGNGNPFVEKSR